MEQDVLKVLLEKLEQITTLPQNEIKASCAGLPARVLKRGDCLIYTKPVMAGVGQVYI
jgi:hypothetical protein